MKPEVYNEVALLWAEHIGLTFPDDLLVDTPSRRPVVELDTYMAGCISGYVTGRGVLDMWRRAILQDCVEDLRDVLPFLSGEGLSRVSRLVRMADLIYSGAEADIAPAE